MDFPVELNQGAIFAEKADNAVTVNRSGFQVEQNVVETLFL